MQGHYVKLAHLLSSDLYYSPGLLLTELAVAGARSAGLTEGDGHLTIMVCETSDPNPRVEHRLLSATK